MLRLSRYLPLIKQRHTHSRAHGQICYHAMSDQLCTQTRRKTGSALSEMLNKQNTDVRTMTQRWRVPGRAACAAVLISRTNCHKLLRGTEWSVELHHACQASSSAGCSLYPQKHSAPITHIMTIFNNFIFLFKANFVLKAYLKTASL